MNVFKDFAKKNIHVLPPEQVVDTLSRHKVCRVPCRINDDYCFLMSVHKFKKHSNFIIKGDTITKSDLHQMKNNDFFDYVKRYGVIEVTSKELGVIGYLVDKNKKNLIKRATL